MITISILWHHPDYSGYLLVIISVATITQLHTCVMKIEHIQSKSVKSPNMEVVIPHTIKNFS